MRHAFADCLLDTGTLTLTRSGVVVAVEPQVFDLIRLLVENAGRVVTRHEIVEAVWDGRIVSESAISARIAAARKAVGCDGKTQSVIRTVARRGLQLVAEVMPETKGVAVPPRMRVTQAQRIRYTRNENGHRLAYASLGDGPPVLRFGPPLTTDLEFEWSSGTDWSCIQPISERFRYLRFDHVGSGQSERAEPRYDFNDEATDAAAVADAAGLERFAGISFSGGVLAAIHFAARYPDRLTRLVIVGGYADGRLRRAEPGATDSLRSMIAEGWADIESPFATAFMTAYFPDGPLESARQMVRQMQTACPLDVMLKDRDAINAASVRHLLPEVRCPTLILHARREAIHPLPEAQKLAAEIPNAELVVLDTANHVPLPGNDVWDAFIETLVDFLAEQDVAAPA